ncbi:MAG: hypothetical protein Q9228_007123, partial [Teloschistes exilis]
MNHQDNVRIFTEGVEDARHEQQTRSHETGPAVSLKLTVDLSKRDIYAVPDEVIDILRVDVERLQLAYNQICYIPDLFSRCRPLKYLNLRHNLFQEFPPPLFSLPQLEILDLSVNEIQKIPEGLARMRSLKVLSLAKNKIKNIPSCVKDLDTLRMLRLAGNPLRSELAVIIEAKDTYPPYDELTDNERETFTTSNLKHQLRAEAEAAARESGDGSSSEGPLETPRPLMRNGSLRFPIKPNGGDYETASEARSPGFAKPPIPARSHFRVTSGQSNLMHKSGLHRPGPAPLHLGNERNRSNSESVLQGAQNNRSKRMGMIKKKNDLGTVEEGQQKRTSFHLRGQSHASALRDWDRNKISVNGANGNGHHASLSETQDIMHARGTLTSHLLLRKRAKHQPKSTFIKGAKGLRYSLVTLDHSTHNLVGSLPNRSMKQWYKLGDAQHEATFRMDSLHHSVNELVRFQEGNTGHSPRYTKEKAVSLSSNACQSAIAKYILLCRLLADQSSQIVANAEKCYVRTLLLIALGGAAELCHAFRRLRRWPSKRTTITQQKLVSRGAPVQASHQALREGPFRDQSLTPTRERPVTAKRVRNWNSPPALQPSIPSTMRPPAPTTQPPVPLYFNGRSRSNSRADQYSLPSSTDSTFAMSPAMTPSTMSQFSVPSTPLNRSRSSSVAASAHGGRMTPAMYPYLENDYGAQVHFDKIYKLLEDTVVLCRKVLPILEGQLRDAANEAQKDAEKPVRDEWSRRVHSCSVTLELSNIMLKRLQAVRYQDPHLRNEKSFWELCKKFLAATSELLMDVRAAYSEGFIHHDIVNLVRPVHKLSRQAGHEINDSQWIQLCSPPPPPPSGRLGPPNTTTTTTTNTTTTTATTSTAATSPNSLISGIPGPHYFGHNRQRRSSGENSYTHPNHTNNPNNPNSNNVPATPLSAALGPAAQATVQQQP